MPRVTIDLPDVPGYYYTGEYRKAKNGEYSLNRNEHSDLWFAHHCKMRSTGPRIILKKGIDPTEVITGLQRTIQQIQDGELVVNSLTVEDGVLTLTTGEVNDGN